MTREAAPRLAVLAPLVAAPPLAGATAWAGMLVIGGLTGQHPIWNLQPQNLPEAVALRDGGAVVGMVGDGDDVNRPAEVRVRDISDGNATVTPLEAAAAVRDEAMTQLLFDLGASPDAMVWHRAFCVSDADSVREVLRAHRPPGALEDHVEQ
jgi:hypothetical protein